MRGNYVIGDLRFFLVRSLSGEVLTWRNVGNGISSSFTFDVRATEEMAPEVTGVIWDKTMEGKMVWAQTKCSIKAKQRKVIR